ncbi:MAG: TonB-dependent receptor [Tannerellaceae bacterium]|nr:TonB-dependent receptor [Tannerellaceae bacterium]
MEKRNSIISFRDLFFSKKRLLLPAFLLLFSQILLAQSGTAISGKVVSQVDNEPLIGVNVVQKGTTNGTLTDLDGNFELTITSASVLEVSYVGFMTQQVNVQPGDRNIRIALKEDAQLLDEVVVVGYGVQKKKLNTGATVRVKGDDIQKMNSINPIAALQSQAPGLSITQTSGMPGEGFKVNVRGIGTTGDSAPLFVIDGIIGGDINSLNPSDIESIDVLKDAASAAIYGSRAANGVILVTTKQGKTGKATITYDGYFGVQNVYKMPSLLNAQEYATIMNEARLMDGLPGYDFASLVPNWESIANGTNKGTNWLDEIRNKNAPIQNHALNISGGTETGVYSIGMSYTSQEGILGKPAQPDFNRYNFRANTEFTLYKKGDLDIIKFGENLTYSYSEKSGIGIGNIYQNDIRYMMRTSPFMPVYDEDGDYHPAIAWNPMEPNPIAYMDYERGQNLRKNHTLRGKVFLTIQPIKNLVFRTNFGVSLNGMSYRVFKPDYNLASNVYRTENYVSQEMAIGHGWIWENTLSYDFNLKDKHNLNVLVGQSMERSGLGDRMKGENVNSIFDDFQHGYLDNTNVIYADRTKLSGGPYAAKHGIASFFGRLNYNYNETYMATVILRADGSSNFARGNRWGYFPSVSAGWVLSNEAFMESTQGFLDFLKLRASWGQNGDQQIDPYQYEALISFNNSNYFFGNDNRTVYPGSYPSLLANPDITWGKSQQLDLGFDARFLNGRLGVGFDYYVKTTKDWLVVAPTLDIYGANPPYKNGGEVENKGVELALSWNDQVGDFTYGANLNLTHNKNEVTHIANTEGIIQGKANVLGEGMSEIYRAQVGFPLGYFYGYKTLGVFQSEKEIADYKGAKLSGAQPGDLIFEDYNGDGVIDDLDRQMIGSPNPKVQLGVNLFFGYKGFDLSIAAHGAFGHQIAKSYRSATDNPLDNYTTEIFGRWHGEGTSNFLPRLTSGTSTNWSYMSDIYIENADYLKLQNITLGYDFKKVFRKIPLGQVRLYISAQNLYTFTGYSGMDPEIGWGADESWASGVDVGNYPSPRTYIIGVNLKF